MRWLKVKRLCSFTGIPYAGNPAWVILEAAGLSDDFMTRLAGELNPLSDAAFVVPEESSEADIGIRFFSSGGEVLFSGHATVATYFALEGEGIVDFEEPECKIRQKSKGGVQYVEVRAENGRVRRVTMKLPLPRYIEVDYSLPVLARMLGLTPAEISSSGVSPEAVSTGMYDLVVPVQSLNQLMDLKPDFNLMSRFCTRVGIVGIQVYTLEVNEGGMASVRHFAPALGVNEDPVSGAACGALACYLLKNGIIEIQDFNRIIIEQGYAIGRPGKVYVHIRLHRGAISEVKVGGQAVTTFVGSILVPD
ncbi:MAG TPA: PhzF family phenazine biosynthesis protein [bacterium (Candidatus Stahlbacteria)]|nr:PhzF family phenazine biosynthesis protein [Candidatus Stahlbacteria bacterium]